MRYLLAVVLVGLFAGCGGGGTSSGEPASSVTSQEAQLPSWVKDALASKAGKDVAATMGSSDFAVGDNRVVFLVVRGNGALVQTPTATVQYAMDGGTPETTKAVLQSLGAHEHGNANEPETPGHFDVTSVYVAHVNAPVAGRYWFVADPVGERIQAVGTLDVKEHSASPAVGSEAPSSDNPTLAAAPAKKITTARPPDTDLLHYSIADSLEAHVPFVVVFATPEFCVSRVCGPAVEVMQKVAKRFSPGGTRFIHVEIYTDNDPKKGFNRWVREWKLPTEPWVFLVDENGVIRRKFEGAISVVELENAIRKDLHTAS